MAFHLARDLPGTGSKSGACGLSDTTGSPDFTAAARQIAGKVERHPGRSYNLGCVRTFDDRIKKRRAFVIVPTLRVVTQRPTLCVNVDAERLGTHSHAERGNDPDAIPNCRSALARDLPGTGSTSGACGVSGTTESPDFATAAR